MTSNTMSRLALAGALAVLPAGLAMAQPTMSTGTGTGMTGMAAAPHEGNAMLSKRTSRNLSSNGTGGSNGIAIGSRGAATGTNMRQPTGVTPGVDPAPTVPATGEGAPPPPTARAPR